MHRKVSDFLRCISNMQIQFLKNVKKYGKFVQSYKTIIPGAFVLVKPCFGLF